MQRFNTHNAYLGVLLFLLVSISVFELHYLLYLGTCFIYYAKVSKKLINVISYLFLIVIIASFSSFFNEVKLYDYIKDITYFTKPILGILAGYFIAKRINSLKTIVKIVVSIALLFAFYHITIILFGVDFGSANVSDIRRVGGISNEIEVISIVFLIASWKFEQINFIKNNFYKKVILIFLFISFSLYFSRTMIVSLIILLLAVFGYIKVTSRGIKYASIVVLSFGLFYLYLFNTDIRRDQTGFESFLYKMKNAPAEIFSSTKSINTKNHADLWDKWRAYEAGMAISQIDSFGSFIFGKGFGALVDLKFAAPLGGTNMRYIPALHNGYVTIFFKSGILGLTLYLVLLLLLYLFANIKTKNQQRKFVYNLIGGLAIHYLFTTLIVTGIYNLKEFYVLILGALFYYSIEKDS